MRSGLQPVAISCNKDSYHDRFAPPVDARALSENASAASNVLRRPILCKKMNVAERLYEKPSNTSEPPRHEANHGSVHERFPARTHPLVVFAHPPLLINP
jgi:hypothetical protein